MIRLWSSPVAALVGLLVALVPAAAPDRKPPRIVAAVMVDLNGNARADRVRLTYSERIRHARDNDGRYTFGVAGYKVLAVGVAAGRSLVILLRERAVADTKARPAVLYRRTISQPVRDRAGNQAVGQLFRGTRAHGHVAPAQPVSAPSTPKPAPSPTPTPTPPTAKDSDKDGYDDAHDCASTDAAIHPGAPDLPDLSFLDSNCDGIDGTEADAVFVSPSGNDNNPGTKNRPKRQIQAAITAAGTDRYVLVAAGPGAGGDYGHVTISSGIRIYGSYKPTTWQRNSEYLDGGPMIVGSPEAVLVSGGKGVVLQLLSVRGSPGAGERSAYGIRVLNGAAVTLQGVVVTADPGLAGGGGADGAAGAPGGAGLGGYWGGCDSIFGSGGGPGTGGSSPVGRQGGKGGIGGSPGEVGGAVYKAHDASPGGQGIGGAPGGAAGQHGNPGTTGGRGASGENGPAGTGGAGGAGTVDLAAAGWVGHGGGAGTTGGPGGGGGGGGGGGYQTGLFVIDGAGNGGGGGGGGAAGGGGGAGGLAGGGSFGIYLLKSSLVVDESLVTAGNGAPGGPGGDGGFGGAGGAGGKGGTVCTSEVGAGGDGGYGGAGGRGGGGGGGAGGPSIGIYMSGAASFSLDPASTVKAGTGGPGGAGGSGGPGGNGAAGSGGSAVPLAQGP